MGLQKELRTLITSTTLVQFYSFVVFMIMILQTDLTRTFQHTDFKQSSKELLEAQWC